MKSHMEEEIEMDDYENIFNPNFKSQFNINESNEYMIKAIPSFDLDNSYATCEIDSQVTKVDISFISTSNNKEKEKNENLIKNKEMSIESIEFLEKCSMMEKSIMADCINTQKEFRNVKSIKDLKNNLFSLDKNINIFMKIPFMRKNLIKLNNISIFNDEILIEKIKIWEIENHDALIKINNTKEDK